MKKTALLCLLLAGCANPGPPYHVDGTENVVTVNYANSVNGSSGVAVQADQHCAKYGKRAQFAGKVNDFTMAFNCVKA